MKKAFKFIYVDERKKIVFSIIAVYITLAISLATTIINQNIKFAINLCQLLLGGILFTFIIADLILKKLNKLPIIALLIFCSVASVFFAKNTLLFSLLVIVLVLKDYSFEEIIKVLYFVLVIDFFAIIFLSIINVIPNWVHYRGEIKRYTLGFRTATLSNSIFMFITLAGAYIWKTKTRFSFIFLEALIAFLLYHFTNSRLGFLMSIFILVALTLIKIFSKIPKLKEIKLNKYFVKVLNFIFIISPFICLFFSLAISYSFKFQNEFILKINKLLSSRLDFAYNAFKNHKLTPFGSEIDWFNEAGNYIGVDCSFLFYIFDVGIVNALIIYLLYSLLIYKTIKIKDNWLLVSLLICLGCGLIEPYLIDYKYNLFALSFVLLTQNKNNETNITVEKNLKENKTLNMDMKILKKVCIVVVTYNRKELLKESLTALLNQDYPNYKIIIIDNASTDGTKEYIEDLMNENVIYFNSGKNFGGAGGFNLGMKKAIEIGCDYVWVMDDDSIVHSDSLSKLTDFANQINDNFGFLSSKVIWTDGAVCRMNMQKISVLKKVKDFNINQKVRFASFVSMLIKREVIEDMGLPIKEFFIWGDDWEYSSRISKKYDCYLVADSVVTHKCAKNIGPDIISDDGSRIDRYKYQFRNETYLYRKNGLKKYYPLYCIRNMLKKLKILKPNVKNKKQKLSIIRSSTKEGKKFNPRIEYAYDKNTNVKVLEFFGEPLAYGGQEAFMINMYKNFERENISYTFCTPFELTNKTLIELTENRNEKIIHYDYNFNSKLRKLYIKKAIKRVLKENNFDVIHIQSGSIYTLLNVSKIAKKAGIKRVIVHSHSTGNKNFKYKLIKHFSDKKIEQYVDEFFACSRLAGEWKFPKSVIEDEKFSVINNGIDTNRFKFNEETRKKYREELNLGNSFTILNVGRFDGMKNHKFMVQFANKLNLMGVKFKFILVGEGNLKEEIISELKSLNIIDNFIFLEKRNDIAEIMMASDVFVLPSLFEGLPVVAVEAQTTGLTTYCSNKITTEVGISDICEFLELDSELWANKIIEAQNLNRNRENHAEITKNSGYDAKDSALLLEKKYLCE